MDQVSILAIEVDLDLVPTEDGRRETPQLAGCGEERIHVPTNLDRPAGRRRPDCSPHPRISRTSIPPRGTGNGNLGRHSLDQVAGWRGVRPDELLRIHEGTRTCGHERVCCIESRTR